MRRKLFTLCSAISLLLCAAVCVLWARKHGVPDLATQREGFGRFCRETLGLEPATLLTAPGELEAVDGDPAKVAENAAWWNERWRRRFPST